MGSSTEFHILTKFIDAAIYAIAYHRINCSYVKYSLDMHHVVPMFLPKNTALRTIMRKVMRITRYFINRKVLASLVVCITTPDSLEWQQRWEFVIGENRPKNNETPTLRPVADINVELNALLQKIVETVERLPLKKGRFYRAVFYYVKNKRPTVGNQQISGGGIIHLPQVNTGLTKLAVSVEHKQAP